MRGKNPDTFAFVKHVRRVKTKFKVDLASIENETPTGRPPTLLRKDENWID